AVAAPNSKISIAPSEMAVLFKIVCIAQLLSRDSLPIQLFAVSIACFCASPEVFATPDLAGFWRCEVAVSNVQQSHRERYHIFPMTDCINVTATQIERKYDGTKMEYG